MRREASDALMPEKHEPGPGKPCPEHATGGISVRRYAYGCSAAIAISGVAFAWMVTGGTFQFLQSLPFSDFYDVQARSWLRGTWSMPAGVLSIEGIRIGGHTFMYYGPVPAALRLPVLLITHRLDGRLTEPSLLIAFLLALVFSSLLSWRVRRLVRGSVPVSVIEAVLTAGLIVVIGLGTVLFFLGSTAQVYEEAELWGATFTLGAFYALVGFLELPGTGRLVATGALATLAMLTRGSVGAGPLVAIAAVALVYLLVWMSDRAPRWQSMVRRLTRLSGVRVAGAPGRFGIGLLAAAGIPLALYVTINEIKFATPFSIPLNRQVLTSEDPHRRAVLAANGGSLFGLKFLPTNLLQFIRPDALAISPVFPWIFFPGKALVLGHVLYTTRDWTSSIPASMPVLFLLGVLGLVLVYRPTSHRARITSRSADVAEVTTGSAVTAGSPGPGVTALRLPLLGAAAGTGGILIIGFIAERYLADAMPFLVLAALPGWHYLMERWPRSGGGRGRQWVWRAGGALLAVLALFELWTTFSLSLFYQRELGPEVTIPQRAGMVSFQEQVHRSLVGGPAPDVRFVSKLPSHAAPLDLAVVGNCAAVYQFDGTSWQPVELGRGGGALLLEASFVPEDRGRRQPLLVTGGSTPQDVVAVTWEGGDLYSFSYYFAGSAFHGVGRTWYTEAPVVVPPGPHKVQVDLVTELGQIYITVGGSPVFSLLYPVAPPDVVRLGSAPPGIPTTPLFAGRVRALPVPTPICNGLENHRHPG